MDQRSGTTVVLGMEVGGKKGTREVLLRAAVFVAMVAAWVADDGARAATDAGDMAVLEELRLGLKGAGAEALGWSATNDACADWAHLECNSGGAVTGIALSERGLMGNLPPALGQLKSLQTLQLQGNSLSGPIPPLAGLECLETVYLDYNEFTLVPPGCFKSLPALVALSLESNSQLAAWPIPADFATSPLLQNLSLTNSNVVGEIPSFLATLPSLQSLRLAYNLLSGAIPPAFSQSNLQILQLNNQLGPVTLGGGLEFLATMQSLTQLWLHGNQFCGTIPASLATASPSLSSLALNNNLLVGPIPSNFRLLPLEDLHLQNNLLDGPIPLISVSPGGQFSFSNNRFCQPIPGAACSPPVSALLDFLASVNYPVTLASSWAGNDPCSAWIGITCSAGGSVSVINLANSRLSGTISPDLAQLASLTVIKLNANALTGSIPDSLTSLNSLRVLDVRDNRLTGPIPRFGRQVQVLVTGNPLSSLAPPRPHPPMASPSPPAPRSALPPKRGHASPKRIPPPGLPPPSSSPSGSALSPPSSSPAGSVSASPALAPAPGSRSIVIPATPPSITNPGANTYEGSIPAPSANDVVLPASQHKRSSVSGAAAMFLIIGAAVLLLFTPLGVFLICRKQRKRFLQVQSPNTVIIPTQDPADADMVKLIVSRRNENAGDDKVISGPSNISGRHEVQVIETGNLVISVEVLRNVTDNFSEAKVLGRGGFGVVYKGKLEDGTKVAVKRMEEAALRSTGLREFQAEIEFLTKVRHRHLVALLGYCIDKNERLLVYEFMPQGALSKHLFDWDKQSTPLKPLDWKKRLVIALDVARGMEYLHSLAHQSFIHRDLKPSNILLDDDFRAKVSDFGLVKLAPEHGRSVETRLAGTFGYLAPEYAVTGRVTTKSDVFSFGVVLMELITGRRALDESQPEENLHLVTCFRRANASKQSLKDAVDKALKQTTVEEEENIESIYKVANLASHCTALDPNRRPDMGHAVSILAPLVARCKNPHAHDHEEDEHSHAMAMDLESLSLPQALKLWQASDLQSSVRHEAYHSDSTAYGYAGGRSPTTTANSNGDELSDSAASSSYGQEARHDDSAASSSYGQEARHDDTVASLPSRPIGFANAFTSSDCR